MLDSNGHKSLVKMVVASSRIIDDTLRLVDKVIRRREEMSGQNVSSLSDSKKLNDQADIVAVKGQLELARAQVKALMERLAFKKSLGGDDQASLGLGLGAGSNMNHDAEDEGDDDGVE